jgi:hypothetical protein
VASLPKRQSVRVPAEGRNYHSGIGIKLFTVPGMKFPASDRCVRRVCEYPVQSLTSANRHRPFEIVAVKDKTV